MDGTHKLTQGEKYIRSFDAGKLVGICDAYACSLYLLHSNASCTLYKQTHDDDDNFAFEFFIHSTHSLIQSLAQFAVNTSRF